MQIYLHSFSPKL